MWLAEALNQGGDWGAQPQAPFTRPSARQHVARAPVARRVTSPELTAERTEAGDHNATPPPPGGGSIRCGLVGRCIGLGWVGLGWETPSLDMEDHASIHLHLSFFFHHCFIAAHRRSESPSPVGYKALMGGVVCRVGIRWGYIRLAGR